MVHELEESSFDRIIHDPPTLALAGELYSKNFYQSLFKVLKPGGILFHYTGGPGKMRRRNIPGGVAGRLKAVGFRLIERRAGGVVAKKLV